MKSRVAILGGVLLAGAAFAGTETVTTVFDLATHEWDPENKTIAFQANKTDEAYTLSSDLDLTGYLFRMDKSGVFDFSEGNHTLTGIGQLMMNGGKYIYLKGGKWDCKSDCWFRLGYYGGTWVNGSEFIVDGAEIDLTKSGGYWQGQGGANNRQILTNGAKVVSAALQHFIQGESRADSTNNLVLIANGSTFKTSTLNIDAGYTTDAPSGNLVLVTGEGSELSSSADLNLGETGAGNTVRYADSASGTIGAALNIGKMDRSKQNALEVAGGASLVFAQTAQIGMVDGADGNRVVVSGAGSRAGALNGANYNILEVGHAGSSNVLKVADGGYLYYGNIHVGKTETAKYNEMVIDGGCVKLEQDTHLGKVAGADHNKLTICNGGVMTNGTYNPVYVGTYGSFNELMIDNGSIGRCRWVTAGLYAGASNNVVTVKGPEAFALPQNFHYMFGCGQYNKWVFSNVTNHYTGDIRHYFCQDDVASTNNTLEIVDGSYLVSYDTYINPQSVSNTLYVGANSTLSSGHDIKIHGFYNDLIVSNATVELTQSGDNLTLGHPDGKDGVHGFGNRLVLQGSHPRVVRVGDKSSFHIAKLYDNSVWRIEVPPEGYEGPIFEQTGLNLHWPFKIEVTGIEELQKNLKKSTKYPFVAPSTSTSGRGGDILFSDLPDGMTRQDVLDEVNATLPKGCYLYTFETYGLGLRVRALTGTVLIVR